MKIGLSRVSFKRNDDGAAALEFAIVAAVFISLSLGIIEFGRSLQVRNELAFAADFGARYMLLNPKAEQSAIISTIRDEFHGYDPTDLTVTVKDETIDGTDFKIIGLSYPMQIIVPGVAEFFTLNVSRSVPVIGP